MASNLGVKIISIRRFLALPSAVSLLAKGENSPLPAAVRFCLLIFLLFILTFHCNIILILQFIDYFITVIHKFKYSSGQNLSFELTENDKWQNITVGISKPYISENNYVENDYVDNYFQ